MSNKKEVIRIERPFVAKELHMYELVVCEQADDNVSIDKTHIFVTPGMIFVAKCDWVELTRRIEADDTTSFESYDTTDGCDYYMKSEYAEYINCALMSIADKYL